MNSLTLKRYCNQESYYHEREFSKTEITEILNRMTKVIFILHIAKDRIRDLTHFHISNSITTFLCHIQAELELMKVVE